MQRKQTFFIVQLIEFSGRFDPFFSDSNASRLGYSLLMTPNGIWQVSMR
jgi:hypothetical protein